MADIVTRLPGLLRPDASRTVLRPFIVEDPSSSDCPRTRRVIDRILIFEEIIPPVDEITARSGFGNIRDISESQWVWRIARADQNAQLLVTVPQ